jgi:hypothetical protein
VSVAKNGKFIKKLLILAVLIKILMTTAALERKKIGAEFMTLVSGK